MQENRALATLERPWHPPVPSAFSASLEELELDPHSPHSMLTWTAQAVAFITLGICSFVFELLLPCKCLSRITTQLLPGSQLYPKVFRLGDVAGTSLSPLCGLP